MIGLLLFLRGIVFVGASVVLLLAACLGGSGKTVLSFGCTWCDHNLRLGSRELLLRWVSLNHDELVLAILALWGWAWRSGKGCLRFECRSLRRLCFGWKVRGMLECLLLREVLDVCLDGLLRCHIRMLT